MGDLGIGGCMTILGGRYLLGSVFMALGCYVSWGG